MKVVNKRLLKLETAVPVYDLSMNPDNPCFALDAGVISHNTIPSGCELRAMYPARFDDSFIIHADYSQMELAILARLSGDENLIAAFKSGKDIHRFVASRVWGLPEDQISGEQRRYAKACFTADQLVVLADFHMKPISDLVIGEKVLAYNEHSEDYDVGEIVAVEMTGIRDTVILTLSTGEQINCTEDHEFLMSSGEYVEARNIEIGRQFMTVNDFELTLVSREEGARNVEVYDIEVTPQHNFLLGAGVIAHNCSFGILYGKSIKSMAEEMMKGDVVATEKLYEDFFGAFPKIKTFIASCHAKLHKDGIIPTLYGDILRIDQSLPGGRSERISVNAPIQSSASTMAGYLIWQLYKRCLQESVEMIPLVFTHDSKDAEIRGSQLFDYIGLMLEEMQDRADKQFGVPARVDWELGVSQHNMIELSIKEHTADKVVAGFKGGIIGLEQVVERLKKTFSNVSYEITESKQEFEDPEEMFTTRRAYTSTWGEYYESVKGILTIDLRRN